MNWLLFWCGFVSSYDIFSTHHNAIIMPLIEANPLQMMIMSSFGIEAAMAVRCFTTVAAIWCILILRKFRPKVAKYVLITWSIQQTFVFLAIFDYPLLARNTAVCLEESFGWKIGPYLFFYIIQ